MAASVKVGDTIPETTFVYVPWSPELEDQTACGAPRKVSTNEWKGKKVLVLSVVGAFTGACHPQIPPYLQHVSQFKSKGVDVIAVVTANDPFVNSGWHRVLGIKDEIVFLTDGYAKWSEKLGLSVDLTEAGLGVRTGRWAALLNDLKVEGLWVEPNPGKVTVTAVEEILKNL